MMKRKILGWIGIVSAIVIIAFGVLDIITKNYWFAIGIPVGIYIIVKYLPDVRGKT